MTDPRMPSLATGSCARVAPELVAAYAQGALGGVAAWSVEAHLPACAVCRSALATELDRLRLGRNRSVLMARLALPTAGPVERAVTRCGVPSGVWQLLSVTPSLRRSWMAGVALVLAVAIGAARLMSAAIGHPAAQRIGGWPVLPAGLMPFLVLAPLLPLAGVAAAFHRRLDPAAELAIAAPISGIWLFCVRSVALIGTALVPTMLAALAMPGGGWLPVLVVLPALAVSAAALGLATLTRPVPAAIGAGAGWVAVVAGLGLVVGSPAAAYGGVAQAASLAVIIAACSLLAARRHTLELGWSR